LQLHAKLSLDSANADRVPDRNKTWAENWAHSVPFGLVSQAIASLPITSGKDTNRPLLNRWFPEID
jgi:hypothetical protein